MCDSVSIRRGQLIALVGAVVVWCGGTTARADATLPVTVDPRVELVSIVQYLAEPPEHRRVTNIVECPYGLDVRAWAAPFSGHRAVRLLAEMNARGFNYDAPYAAIVHLGPPPALQANAPFSDYVLKRAGGQAEMQKFIAALRRFADETHFMDFFASHRGTYDAIVARTTKALGPADRAVATLTQYVGSAHDRHELILAPMLLGNFGPSVRARDGRVTAYFIAGTGTARDGLPWFGTPDVLKQNLTHEFAHSYINELTEKHRRELDRYAALYEPIAPWMRPLAYSSWETAVNEHIIHALTIRLTTADGAARDEEIISARKEGFFYLPLILERLGAYERDRANYPDLASFYPRLVDIWREMSTRPPTPDFFIVPFRSTVGDAEYARPRVVFVVPTGESNSEDQARIVAYARRVHDAFAPDAPFLTDVEALRQPATGRVLLLYGTPSGNLWVARRLGDRLPFRFAGGRVAIAGRTFSGDHIRVICALPNPDDPRFGIVVHSAAAAADVNGINSVENGPTDYVVANGQDVLDASNFPRSDSAHH